MDNNEIIKEKNDNNIEFQLEEKKIENINNQEEII
jgi:hypothetical protein